MLRLKREHGVPALSMHDAIIVPVSAEEVARETLRDEFVRVVGIEPRIK